MSSSNRRRLFTALVVSGGLALTGLAACVASSDEPPPAPEEVRHRHGHGPTSVVIETTLARAELSDEQRLAVEAIRDRLRADRQDREAVREDLRTSAGEVVRSGTADSEQFQHAVDRATEAIEARVALSAAAVEEIHATLSPAQRAAVAEGLRERIDRRLGKHHRERHEGFKDLTADLMLRPEQVEALKEIRDDLLGQDERLRPTPEELHELVDAFEGEDFAEELAAFHAEKAEILRHKLAAAGGHADTVLELLDADQRDVLALLVERGPDAIREQRRTR